MKTGLSSVIEKGAGADINPVDCYCGSHAEVLKTIKGFKVRCAKNCLVIPAHFETGFTSKTKAITMWNNTQGKNTSKRVQYPTCPMATKEVLKNYLKSGGKLNEKVIQSL